ncbi:MAG: hypothetical protein ACR2RV_14635 [Verrucomicrobiales bacterium]
MDQRILPIAAITVSLVAIVVSFASRGKRTSDAEIAKLEGQVQQLEARLDSFVSRRRSLSAIPTTDSDILEAPPQDRGDAVIQGKHGELAIQLDDLGVFEFFEAKQQAVAESYAVTLDPNAPSKARLKALGTLREADRIDDTVVASMVALWGDSLTDSSGGWTRWFLMENLEGIRDPAFRDSILNWLPEEESPKMRGRAVETLGTMLPDQEIDDWLIHIADNDPEPKLRELAAEIQAQAQGAADSSK